MLSTKRNVKTTLLRGPAELRKTFLFEAAIYWAEEGHQVLYIAAAPLDKLPAPCHDRNASSCTAFKLMRFMYLSEYKSLAEQLTELHTFSTLPSVLLIDDLDHYLEDETTKRKQSSEEDWMMHVARTCSIIFDTANCCSRILNDVVHVCAWSSILSERNIDISMFFRNIWDVTEEEDGKTILLHKLEDTAQESRSQVFRYRKFQDGSRILFHGGHRTHRKFCVLHPLLYLLLLLLVVPLGIYIFLLLRFLIRLLVYFLVVFRYREFTGRG